MNSDLKTIAVFFLYDDLIGVNGVKPPGSGTDVSCETIHAEQQKKQRVAKNRKNNPQVIHREKTVINQRFQNIINRKLWITLRLFTTQKNGLIPSFIDLAVDDLWKQLSETGNFSEQTNRPQLLIRVPD